LSKYIGEALTFKVSTRCKYAIVVLLALLLLVELVDRNLPETMAFWWHLRHGFKVQCCGIQVRVPLMYFADVYPPEYPRSVSLVSMPGYLRWRWFHSPHATISLFEAKSHYNAEQLQQGKELIITSWSRGGYRLVQTRQIEVAGQPLECSELFTEHLDVLGANYVVWCMGNGPSVSFEGSPALLNDFYSIVEGARSIQQSR
jgi:hypothetical protein